MLSQIDLIMKEAAAAAVHLLTGEIGYSNCRYMLYVVSLYDLLCFGLHLMRNTSQLDFN